MAGGFIWGRNAFIRSLPVDEEVAAIDESAIVSAGEVLKRQSDPAECWWM